ncbi:MAG: CDP-alcohol phosphatidyltransferase family protein, partial [Pseudomonadota bacterium]
FVLVDTQQNALAGALLLAGFLASGITFLAHAVLAKDYDKTTQARGKKSFFHLWGLVEGSETITFFVLFCLFPAYFAYLAILFAGLCFISASIRVYATWQSYRLWVDEKTLS